MLDLVFRYKIIIFLQPIDKKYIYIFIWKIKNYYSYLQQFYLM